MAGLLLGLFRGWSVKEDRVPNKKGERQYGQKSQSWAYQGFL
jgi:hypothetical protein